MQDLEGIFNQLLALKTRDMTSIVAIMTRGGSMMNEKGATKLPDEWARSNSKNDWTGKQGR
jgi:hypothetical protein